MVLISHKLYNCVEFMNANLEGTRNAFASKEGLLWAAAESAAENVDASTCVFVCVFAGDLPFIACFCRASIC